MLSDSVPCVPSVVNYKHHALDLRPLRPSVVNYRLTTCPPFMTKAMRSSAVKLETKDLTPVR